MNINQGKNFNNNQYMYNNNQAMKNNNINNNDK